MTKEIDEAARVLEALNIGLEIEAYGFKFYSKAAQDVKDPKGRQTLRFLADEEKDHLKFIRELKESLTKKDDSVLKGIVKEHLSKQGSKVFPELEEYMEEIREARGDKLILGEAEEIEKRSVKFYNDSAKGIENKDYQDIFRVLIKEEEGHLKLVEQMADYMTLHGVWSGLENYFANE
jgi:rubrerythrin